MAVIHRALIILSAVTSAMLLVPACGSAQNRPAVETTAETVLVRLAPAAVQTLAGALRSVAQQANVSFVCEGKPFRPLHSAPPLLPVIAKWPPSGVSLTDAVAQIADAYDYEAERKGDVFLLRKRYTDARDLPDVTADEVRLALRDASRAASALPAPTVAPADVSAANSPFASAFFNNLPSSVQAKFNRLPTEGSFGNPTEGIFSGDYGSIAISNMTTAQKDTLWQAAVSRHIQAATGKAATAYQALLTFEEKDVAFFEGQPIAKTTNPSKPAQNAEKAASRTLAYLPKRRSAVFPDFAPDGRIWEVPPLTADYGANGNPLPVSESNEMDATQTLQSLCDASAASRAHLIVDPALQAKTVLVIVSPIPSGERDMRDTVFQAAGAVYGLRVLHGENNTLRISRARAAPPKELNDLNAAVLSAFPEPLFRAFHARAKTEIAKQLIYYRKSHENQPNYDPKSADFADKIFAEGMGRFYAGDAIRLAALHRFRVLLTPRLEGSSVLANDLTPEEKQMLFLALAADGINAADELESKRPAPTRVGLEKGRLSGMIIGGRKEKRLRFDISLGRGEDGKEGSNYYLGSMTFPPTPPK